MSKYSKSIDDFILDVLTDADWKVILGVAGNSDALSSTLPDRRYISRKTCLEIRRALVDAWMAMPSSVRRDIVDHRADSVDCYLGALVVGGSMTALGRAAYESTTDPQLVNQFHELMGDLRNLGYSSRVPKRDAIEIAIGHLRDAVQAIGR